MRTRFFKFSSAALAALALGTIGCESSEEDTGGTTDADAADGSDSTDGTDGTDSTDAADGTEAGGGDTTDGTDATDGTDGTDGEVSTDSTVDGEDGIIEEPPPCEVGSKITAVDGKDQCCTCSGDSCENGLDNSLAGIASLANSALQGTIEDGDVNIVAELVGDTASTFTINMYTADLDPANAECDINNGPCNWQLGLEAFGPECTSLISFNNATIDAEGNLNAGGKEGLFVLSLPIQGFVLELKVIGATIVGTVERDDKGAITKMAGILGGAVPKAALEEAVDKLPEDGLPLPKPAIKNLLATVIKADIDGLDAAGATGTDGVKESASVAIVFEGIPGAITALESAEGQDPAPVCTEAPALETYSDVVFRMNALQLGSSGKAGQALDVDGVCVEPNQTPAEG